jgi:hypothetical protein
MMDAQVQRFVSWASANIGRLRKKRAEDAADAICEQILKVDGGLGVEVSQPCGKEERELIITAFSDPALFPLVPEIVDRMPPAPGWRFIPLKPPRGFDFTNTVGHHKLQASALEFSPIPEIKGGVQLLVPEALMADLPPENDREEMAWLIVEGGIGEVLASLLAHIEFAAAEGISDKRPISELASFVAGDA